MPGLWEAQGHLDLDGAAWYRRRFVLDGAGGHWTLRFGAVMDVAEVFLNGRPLGSHELPFTPFELDATGAVERGENVLAVRVVDPPHGDPEHARSPHGKQGWANDHFPSRPSLYMTYGGIWQSVTLRRHGPVVLRHVFVESDPDDLAVGAEVSNQGAEAVRVRVGFRALALGHEEEVELAPGERRWLSARLGPTAAPRWTPSEPALHELRAEAAVEGEAGDERRVRFGLRTIRVDGDRLLLNGEPYRMKGALVQGFTADGLYAEPDRGRIEAEVRAAAEMGFNTLRLHIKAFDPTYLDVCDELGMLVQCDVPVAEPIAYEELGADTTLARRCVAAARAQVLRDRNHPSIVLWSAMNEIGDRRREIRSWPGYERFVRAVAGAVRDADPTRPLIENDWVEPDPGRVFVTPILTAHWYGRLHRDWLTRLEEKARSWAGVGRPLLVTEYGDWGLPDMPSVPEPPFWDVRELYVRGLAETRWPGTIDAFVRETQRAQGLSDRLQTEILRRHEHLGGYCLTELTDVPHELNGLLDLHRRPKLPAVEEMTRANQVVLPMLALDGLVVEAGSVLRPGLHVANDGAELEDVELEVTRSDAGTVARLALGRLAGHAVFHGGPVELRAPAAAGRHELDLRLRSRGREVAANRYPLHVVAPAAPPRSVRLLGGGATAEALAAVGSATGDEGPTVVAEAALDASAARETAARLQAGGTVVVLAQGVEASGHYPAGLELRAVATGWGSSLFHFTAGDSPLSTFPRGAVLVGEDSTVRAGSVVAGVAGRAFPAAPMVVAYKPSPRPLTGTVVGAHDVGRGRLVFCQYELAGRVLEGDAAARSLLADLLACASRR